MKYMVSAVSRDADGKVTDIQTRGRSTLLALRTRKPRLTGKTREPGDVAKAFEITDASGNALTWRPFRKGGKPPSWS
jgi:hypothetical protein